jgi:hypothetical protein
MRSIAKAVSRPGTGGSLAICMPTIAALSEWAAFSHIPAINLATFVARIPGAIEASFAIAAEGEPISRRCERAIKRLGADLTEAGNLASELRAVLEKISSSGVLTALDGEGLGRRVARYNATLLKLASDAASARTAIDERLLAHLRRPPHAPSKKFESSDCPPERRIAGLFYELVIREGGRLSVNKNLSDRPSLAGTFPAFILKIAPHLPPLPFAKLSAGAFAAIKQDIDRKITRQHTTNS